MDAPVVTGIDPATGPSAGDTTVTITGTDLAGATEVTFGSTDATDQTVVNDTTITALTPPGPAGAADVVVTTPYGDSGGSGAGDFTYVDARPTVTSISPNQGHQAGGAIVVEVTGTGFTPGSVVEFGPNAASSVVYVSSTSVVTMAPAGSGVVGVTVTTAGGTSAGGIMDHFTYRPIPTVTAISPAEGRSAGGTEVTITGTGFGVGTTSADSKKVGSFGELHLGCQMHRRLSSGHRCDPSHRHHWRRYEHHHQRRPNSPTLPFRS